MPFVFASFSSATTASSWTRRRLSNAQWTVTSGGSFCALSTDDAGSPCVQDTGGNYGANEDCSFTLETGGATLVRMEWGLEDDNCDYDYLQVAGGTRYCDATSSAKALPASMAVSGPTTFAFHSDGSVFGVGFKICAQPPAGTTWSPTSAPTPSPPTPARNDFSTPARWTDLAENIKNTPSSGSAMIVLDMDFDCSDYTSQITIPTSTNITIHGNGAVLDAVHQGRFFTVDRGATLALDHLMLRHGRQDRSMDGSSVRPQQAHPTSICSNPKSRLFALFRPRKNAPGWVGPRQAH